MGKRPQDAAWSVFRLVSSGEWVCASFSVCTGQRIPFVLTHGRPRPAPGTSGREKVLADTGRSLAGVHRLLSPVGPWTDTPKRSLITLKALSYNPTGSIMTAAAASLPEQLGGTWNWHYRSCWLRDATMTLMARLSTSIGPQECRMEQFSLPRTRED